jgi:UDP-3-O-[3-hydroxymyristoyl] glucosamine N-acyltransferase
MLVSLGYKQANHLRADKYLLAKEKEYRLINTIIDSASIHTDTLIGDNCMVGKNAIIDPFVEIGYNISINHGVIVGHYTVIKDHCFLAPGVITNGSVTIEPYYFIGAG